MGKLSIISIVEIGNIWIGKLSATITDRYKFCLMGKLPYLFFMFWSCLYDFIIYFCMLVCC
ncbi:hypothetical protein GIB67_015369 [Kingdonia uniflora]|uniref:Uncharacterized protein n=1 Tax=Kingdonia uniflora TaxID=39325 RepID=A0A7J7KYS3_9MAGN|nr:hypothetical protein GIB67_015369 [Kingdonia uniflora]